MLVIREIYDEDQIGISEESIPRFKHSAMLLYQRDGIVGAFRTDLLDRFVRVFPKPSVIT